MLELQIATVSACMVECVPKKLLKAATMKWEGRVAKARDI